jgi:hypothetical protein
MGVVVKPFYFKKWRKMPLGHIYIYRRTTSFQLIKSLRALAFVLGS